MKTPWYMDVQRQIQVMDRVAQMCGYRSLEEQREVLDSAMETLWEKVRVGYERVGRICAEPEGRGVETIRAGNYMRRTI